MTRTDPTADAFMRRILADPADPVPRLVFADWLEETGAAVNVAWARYIRLADELANLPVDDPRRPKMADHLNRIGGLVRAQLTYRAELFVAYPDAMTRVLPTRNMVLNVAGVVVPEAAADLVPASLAHELPVLPLALWGPTLVVALPDPRDRDLVQHLRFIFNRDLLAVRAPVGQIRAAVNLHYGPAEFLDHGFPIGPAARTRHDDVTPLAIWPPGEHGPEARLVNLLIGEAIQLRATAVELEPRPDRLLVWHHTDGDRRERDAVPLGLLAPIAYRVRLMAGIPPTSQPSAGGEIPLHYRGLTYRLPVQITRTPHGPHIEIRIQPAAPETPAAVVNPAA